MAARTKKNQYQSVFDKEAYLSEKSQKAFADFIKETKKQKLDPSEFSQTIICGSKEQKLTKKKSAKRKNG